MDEERMIRTTSARIELARFSRAPSGQYYIYELAVPKLLDKEQMELILQMISQMKRGGSYTDSVRLTWFKREE